MTRVVVLAMSPSFPDVPYSPPSVPSLEEWPDPAAHLCRSSKGIPSVKLTPLQWSVWEQFSPGKTVQQISLDLEEDLFAVRQACAHLIWLGLAFPVKVQPPQGAQAKLGAGGLAPLSWCSPLGQVWHQIRTCLRSPSVG